MRNANAWGCLYCYTASIHQSGRILGGSVQRGVSGILKRLWWCKSCRYLTKAIAICFFFSPSLP